MRFASDAEARDEKCRKCRGLEGWSTETAKAKSRSLPQMLRQGRRVGFCTGCWAQRPRLLASAEVWSLQV